VDDAKGNVKADILPSASEINCDVPVDYMTASESRGC
jgi:hypothetical protein